MPIELTNKTVNERGTAVFPFSFFDENGEADSPAYMKWSLVSDDKEIIAGLENVEVTSPAHTTEIVLSGDDLQILSSEEDQDTVARRLVIEGTYNSSDFGVLPFTEQLRFFVNNLHKIS